MYKSKDTLFLGLWGVMILAAASFAGVMPGAPPPSVSEPQLVVSNDALLEEGKALFENQQYMAALGKFMTILRRDPHNPDARAYLARVVDVMRQNPASVQQGAGSKTNYTDPAVQEELRKLMRQRSLFTLDLKAIPGVSVDFQNGAARVNIDTSLLFADSTGGLREEGVPVLDRVATWLKTFGEQPVILHCYPEELQDPAVNGSLFLHRYSELYNFFVEERKMSPQRFVSADLLVQQAAQAQADSEKISISTASAPHVVIETLGSKAEDLDGMPAAAPQHAMSRWLELSVMSSKSVFNPEEGEWASLDIAALTRTGLATWALTIAAAETPTKPVMSLSGKGNLLKRISWDGHDMNTGSFVASGAYNLHLVATDSDGTLMSRDLTIQVQRTTEDTTLVNKVRPAEATAAATKPKPKKHKKKAHPKTGPNASDASTAVAPAFGASTTASGTSNSSDTLLDSSKSTAASSAAPEEAADSVHAIWKQVIEFDPDQSDLKPTLKASLERIGKTLEVYPLQKVRIVGFAVITEQDATNLAKKRADKVRSILIDEYHVDRNRVIDGGGKTVAEDGASKVELSITN